MFRRNISPPSSGFACKTSKEPRVACSAGFLLGCSSEPSGCLRLTRRYCSETSPPSCSITIQRSPIGTKVYVQCVRLIGTTAEQISTGVKLTLKLLIMV